MSSSLKEFCEKYNIDKKALERVKKRVFVVGRFNNKPTKDDPDVFLFTNRADTTDEYLKNFASNRDLDYGRFVELLKPKAAERVEHADPMSGKRFDSYELVVPRGTEDDLETSYVMDTYNYFFQRAILTCEQEAIKRQSPNIPKLLEDTAVERGRTILKQIRSNLTTFCTFQKDAPEIAKAIIKLFGQCAGEHGLPHYAQGAPLPIGFIESLVEFIFQEDQSASYDCSNLDFDAPGWKSLKASAPARETLNKAVNAFRDALVSDSLSHYNDLVFRGKTLSQHAKEVVEGEIKDKYRKARDAYNGLRQILRSKILLSMVLEWLVHSYYLTVDEKPPLNDYDQDCKIEDAILQGIPDVIATPIKRPTKAERRKFSKALTENFATMIQAVVETNTQRYEELAAKLPNELQELAEKLRKDPEKRAALAKVSGAAMGEDLQKAFFSASRMILLDVLCPVLYRKPTMNVRELKKLARQETMAAFLTAIFLSEENEEAIASIGEKHLEYFESKINKKTKEITDVGQIQSLLLNDFVDVLCAPDLQQQIQEGIKVLMEVFALRKEVQAGEHAGSSPIVVMRAHEGRDPLAKTTPDMEVVKVGVGRKVEAASRKAAAAAAKKPGGNGASAIAASARTGDAEPSAVAVAEILPKVTPIVEGPLPGAEEEEEDVALEAAAEESELDSKIGNILEKILIEDRRGATEEDKAAAPVPDRVNDLLLHDRDFMNERAESLKKFDQVMHLIYTRYVQHKNDKQTFRNAVERMTLLNMLLKFQEELGMGKGHSNLYRLLIDLVLHLDAEKPDPRDFIREKSLTMYFDDADLQDGGLTELRQLLEIQAVRSLRNVEAFVSELRGVKYLMDAVGQSRDTEVIVVNATADQFLQWLTSDNLTSAQGKGLMRLGRLIDTNSASQRTIPPGLVYMTDSAFFETDKEAWVNSLSEFKMQEETFGVVLPPLLISTGPHTTRGEWRTLEEKVARAGQSAPAPIVMMGPSPYLNRADDGFKTILPAGYLFCAHFLGCKDQKLTIPSNPHKSVGRARSIGRGEASMFTSMGQIVWGEGPGENYCFAADFYLYLLALIWGTCVKFGGAAPQRKEFFSKDTYFYIENDGMPKPRYETTRYLDGAVIGPSALAFSLDQNLSIDGEKLKSVSVAADQAQSLASARTERWHCTEVNWFNVLLERAGL